jgi:hypothetical protein
MLPNQVLLSALAAEHKVTAKLSLLQPLKILHRYLELRESKPISKPNPTPLLFEDFLTLF